jgi:hypothetical protein
VFGQTASAGGAGGLFQNTSTGTGAQILVAEDGSGTQRFSVDTQGNASVIIGSSKVKVPIAVNHARAVENIPNPPTGDYAFTLNWTFPFPDTDYTVTCSLIAPGSDISNIDITGVSQNTVDVLTAPRNGGPMTINCIGIHD